MIKRIILFILVANALSNSGLGQEIIELKTGQKIEACNTEILDLHIVYVTCNKNNSKKIKLSKSLVKQVIYRDHSIVLENHDPSSDALKIDRLGMSNDFWFKYYVNGQAVTSSSFMKKMEENPTALNNFSTARKNHILTSFLSGINGFVVGYHLMNKSYWKTHNIFLHGSLFVIFEFIRSSMSKKMQRAIAFYNSDTKGFSFSVQRNGIGFCLNF